MQYIAASQLRTQTPALIEALKGGESVDLIYRSQVVATIIPPKPELKKKKLSISQFLDLIEPVKKLTDKERNLRYRKALEAKYG